MINLPNSNYTWFPVQLSSKISLYLNLNSISVIASNFSFIEDVKKSNSRDPLSRYRDSLNLENKFKSEEYKLSEIEKYHNEIHFTPILTTELFNSVDKRTGFNQNDKLWLMAERFYWDFASFNLGSSRHILIKNIQLKGSGKNPMATRPDDAHAWGGSHLWSNLKGLAFNIIYQAMLPSGLQKILSISLWPDDYKNKNLKSYELNSMVIREAKSYRLTQLMSGLDPQMNYKSTYQNAIKSKIPEEYNEYIESLYFQYGSMLCFGIQDLNITKENVLLDSSLIDYEDVSYRGDNNNQIITLKLYYPEKIKSFHNKEEVIRASSIYLSDYHLYLDAIQMTQKTYNKFFETNYNEKLNEGFLNFVMKFKNEVYNFSDFQFEIYKILSKHTALYRNGIPYFHLAETIDTDLIKILTNVSDSEISFSEADDGNTIISFDIKAPRGVWKNESLNSYYTNLNCLSIDELTTPVLKLTDLYTKDRENITFEDSIKFSSQVNSILSKNSWLLPYSFKNNNFKLEKFKTLESVCEEIKQRIDLRNYKIKSYSGVLIDDINEQKNLSEDDLKSVIACKQDFILQGVMISYSDFPEYFMPVSLFIGN